MTEYLYHGSAVEGIRTLRAGSALHGTGEKAAYLTDHAAYALFYIWDAGHVGWTQKHVTAWVEDGTAWYEEQFLDQLAAFYQGAAGWLYRVEYTPEIQPVKGREALFYAPGGAAVNGAEYIPDVYEALMEEERRGRMKVRRFRERTRKEQEELTGRIARYLRENGMLRGREEAGFYRRYFGEAWKLAELLGD